MTAFDYSGFVATALRLITRFGTDATIIRKGETTGPDYNPTYGPPTEHACKVVYDQWKADQIDGTLIRSGDLKILVAASGLAIDPKPEDTFKDGDGAEYAIINVMPLKPGGVVVMHEMQVRA